MTQTDTAAGCGHPEGRRGLEMSKGRNAGIDLVCLDCGATLATRQVDAAGPGFARWRQRPWTAGSRMP